MEEFQAELHASVARVDELMATSGSSVFVEPWPDEDPTDYFDDAGDPDGAVAAAQAGRIACYEVMLVDDDLVEVGNAVIWTTPTLEERLYKTLSELGDDAAVDLHVGFLELLGGTPSEFWLS